MIHIVIPAWAFWLFCGLVACSAVAAAWQGYQQRKLQLMNKEPPC